MLPYAQVGELHRTFLTLTLRAILTKVMTVSMTDMGAITVPEGYGYVVAVSALSFIVFSFLAEMVVYARKKFDVPYPTMYSEKSKQFNCYQRAHQNALETLPFYMAFLLLGGLQYPVVASIAGAVWLVGRLIYAVGYYTGDAGKRAPGSIIGFLALFVLLGCTISLALHMLNFI